MSLVNLEQSILAEIDAATDEASLEAVRVSVLGKKGSISERMKGLGSMSPEERKDAGAALNVLKDKIADALSLRKANLQEAALDWLITDVRRQDVVAPSPQQKAMAELLGTDLALTGSN